MSSFTDSDREALYDPQNVELFVASIIEGFCQGHELVAQDDILSNSECSFYPTQIEPRIDIWNGKAELDVPIDAGEYLAAEIPCHRTFFARQMSIIALNRWDDILEKLMDVRSDMVY